MYRGKLQKLEKIPSLLHYSSRITHCKLPSLDEKPASNNTKRTTIAIGRVISPPRLIGRVHLTYRVIHRASIFVATLLKKFN
jgi:hypothetical protein